MKRKSRTNENILEKENCSNDTETQGEWTIQKVQACVTGAQGERENAFYIVSAEAGSKERLDHREPWQHVETCGFIFPKVPNETSQNFKQRSKLIRFSFLEGPYLESERIV